MKFFDWNDKEHESSEDKEVSWRPSAYALVIKNGKVLLVRAKSHGKWELPGGGVELNEKIKDGLVREVFEETGYKLSVKDSLPLYLADNCFYAPDMDKYFRAIRLVFESEVNGESNTEKVDFEKEVLGIEWIELSELKNYEVKQIVLDSLKEYLERRAE